MQNLESQFRIGKLITLHLSGQISPDAKAELDAWINRSEHNSRIFNSITDQANLAHALQEITNVDAEPALQNVRRKMAKEKVKPGREIKFWLRMAVAVAILFVIGVIFYFYSTQYKGAERTNSSVNDIAPGKNAATLTLNGGKKILLSEVVKGAFAKENGVKITKTAEGQIIYELQEHPVTNQGGKPEFNILTTSRGEQYQVWLPDGTRVWLNAASKLTYPSTFSTMVQRKVELMGEAYFEVTKDSKHPFIVVTDRQHVEVLGTHFNVMAYKDEKFIKTTLLEGSVKVSGKDGKSQLLKPGQQAQATSANVIISDNVDLEDVVAWKNGYFKFNENLVSIMNKISRWYDVDVVYKIQPDAELTYSGKISRERNISAILKIIEFNGDVHFKIEGRRIIVMK